MATIQLIKASLEKSKNGKLGGSCDSVLFQDICETALEVMETKENILKSGLEDVINMYENEYGKKLSNEHKIKFLEGFNYACILLTNKNK